VRPANQFRPPETAEIAIIGGGVIGLTIARALARRGVQDVVVIEKNQFGREASWAAGGILAPQVETGESDEFFRLACASRDLYPQFAAELRAESDVDVEFDTTGTLYVGFTDQDEAELRRRLEWQQVEGLRAEWLTGEDARRMEPCLSETVRCALRFPDDYQIENRKLLEALIVANQERGVHLVSACGVLSLTFEDMRICGVETSNGFISARQVVMAAGAWSSTINLPETIAIEPIRGQMLCFKSEPKFARHVIYSSRGYLIPRHDGRLLAGSTAERAGFDKRVTEDGTRAIKSLAGEIAPVVNGMPILDSWAGFRPRSADGLPVLGSSETVKGLFYATGHYRNGILLAPITGELIADEIIAGTRSSIPKAFLPQRFSQKSDREEGRSNRSAQADVTELNFDTATFVT
jgi:glycine oxidase